MTTITNPITPPGPQRRWLGFNNLRAMQRDYLGFTQGLRRAHGDITYMHLVYEHAYDLHSPDLVRAALVDNAANLIRWERGIEVLAQNLGQSVLVTEGALWQRQRRMLQPGFAPRRVAGYARLMVQAAEQALDNAVPAGAGQSALVNVDSLLTRLTMDVILRTLFSSNAAGDAANALQKESQDAARAVQILSQVGFAEMFNPITLPDWLPLPGKAKKRWALRSLGGLITRQIEARQRMDAASAPQDDLLAMLLNARDDGATDNAQPSSLSQTELQDQCAVMFQAGHETSATALLWWCRLMAQHPQVAQKAQSEVDRVLAGRAPTPDDLPHLDWLSATLKEAMRMYPPVAALMSRRAVQAVQVGDWKIPKGAMVRVTPWVLHHDERWFSDPQAFKPERFVAGAEPPPRGAYIPFGTGPRVCIGQHFAVMEMTLIAAMLLQRYTLSVQPGTAMPATKMGVTLRPQTEIELVFTRRGNGKP